MNLRQLIEQDVQAARREIARLEDQRDALRSEANRRLEAIETQIVSLLGRIAEREQALAMEPAPTAEVVA